MKVRNRKKKKGEEGRGNGKRKGDGKGERKANECLSKLINYPLKWPGGRGHLSTICINKCVNITVW